MAEKTPMPYAQAKVLADEVVEILSGVCLKIDIAGSIRRKCVMVGDIEIVAIPKPPTQLDMFDEPVHGAAHELYDALLGYAEMGAPFGYRLNVNGQKSFGQQMMLLTYKGFALDVFCTTPEQWAVTLLIRTGSANFSKSFAMLKHQGGRLAEGQRLHGWRITQNDLPLETPTEESVFDVTGNRWIAPEDRE